MQLLEFVIHRYLFAMFIICTCLAAQEAEMTEIRLGTIVSPPEDYAAKELQHILLVMTGRKYPIICSNELPNKGAFVLGTPQSLPAVKEHAQEWRLERGKDEMAIMQTVGNNLFLVGNLPRCVLYAVYVYAQQELDVHWWKPGAQGEDIPRRKNIYLPRIKYHYHPPFRYRAMSLCGLFSEAEAERWLARNFINTDLRNPDILNQTGTVRSAGGHNVAIYDSKVWREHPEYYAMLNGKRERSGFMGCWSNPQFYQYILGKLLKEIDQYHVDYLSIFPADSGYFCTCETCKTMEANPSKRWFIMYNKLVDDLQKKRPHVDFGTIAYQYYSEPPNIPIKSSVIEYCQSNRCYFHPLNSPCNEHSMKIIQEWMKYGKIGIYGYHFDMFLNDRTYLSAPFWNIFKDEIQTARKLKFIKMKTELPVKDLNEKYAVRNRFDRMGFSAYIYAQLTWNPDLDISHHLQRWCDFHFGSASRIMVQYFNFWEELWHNTQAHQSGYWWYDTPWTARQVLTMADIRKLHGMLIQAEKACIASSFWHHNVLVEKQLLNEWAQYYFMACSSLAIFKGRKQTIPGMDDITITFDEKNLTLTAQHDTEIVIRTVKGETTFPIRGKEGKLNIGLEQYGINPQTSVSAAISCRCGDKKYPSHGLAALAFREDGPTDRKMAWLMPDNVPNNRNMFVSRFAVALSQDSWSYEEVRTGNLDKMPLDDYSFFVITMNGSAIKQIPQKFYKDKLLPVVEKGGTVVFNTNSYNTVSVPDMVTGNPKLELAFKWMHKNDKAYYPDADFAHRPHQLDKIFPLGTYGTITPIPGSENLWRLLGTQGPDAQHAHPWILAHSYGKGWIIVNVGRFIDGSWCKILTNIQEWQRKASPTIP